MAQISSRLLWRKLPITFSSYRIQVDVSTEWLHFASLRKSDLFPESNQPLTAWPARSCIHPMVQSNRETKSMHKKHSPPITQPGKPHLRPLSPAPKLFFSQNEPSHLIESKDKSAIQPNPDAPLLPPFYPPITPRFPPFTLPFYPLFEPTTQPLPASPPTRANYNRTISQNSVQAHLFRLSAGISNYLKKVSCDR